MRFAKFRVYNVHNMADEFMVVSGMPEKIGKFGFTFILQFEHLHNIIRRGACVGDSRHGPRSPCRICGVPDAAQAKQEDPDQDGIPQVGQTVQSF